MTINTACRLCLNGTEVVGALCNSHIIPRFMIMKSKDKGKTLSYSRGQSQPVISQLDWKEYLLCKSCEQVMKAYEDYINEVLFLHRKRPTVSDTGNSLILIADNDFLLRAFLSIFWRAIVSSLPEFKFALAPDYIQEDMRKWIFGSAIPKNWTDLVSAKITQINDGLGQEIAFLATPYVRNNYESGYFEFIFIFAGYCCTFEIPPLPARLTSRRFWLRPWSQILRIKKLHYTEIPELRQMVEEMISAKNSLKSTDE